MPAPKTITIVKWKGTNSGSHHTQEVYPHIWEKIQLNFKKRNPNGVFEWAVLGEVDLEEETLEPVKIVKKEVVEEFTNGDIKEDDVEKETPAKEPKIEEKKEEVKTSFDEMDRDQLKAVAEELNLEYYKTISTDKLRKLIKEA